MIEFKESVLYLLDNYMSFIADEYTNFNNQKKKGEGHLNKNLDNDLKIDYFSLGNIKSLSTSFVFATVGQASSGAGNTSLGDTASFEDDITLLIQAYKQIKPHKAFECYTILPLVLNQISRYWIGNANIDGERNIYNPSMSADQPIFDYSQNKASQTLNDFSNINGLAFTLRINFKIRSGTNDSRNLCKLNKYGIY